MQTKFRRRVTQLAISAAIAVVTPAAAAGLMSGVSAAATTVAEASAPVVLTGDRDAALADPQPATHAPARLSPLAGNDEVAWADARSVHRHVRH
jgi:hypothetical protein